MHGSFFGCSVMDAAYDPLEDTMTRSQSRPLPKLNTKLTSGPIFKSLFLFMLPIFFSSLFQQLYNTVDIMIVGNVLGD